MKRFIPALAWSLFILLLSTGPGISLPQSWWDLFSIDKLGHFVAYAVLSMSLLWAVQSNTVALQRPERKLLLIIGWSIFYGVLMEFIQYRYFPNRYFEILDIIANIIGSFAGLYFYNLYFLKFKK